MANMFKFLFFPMFLGLLFSGVVLAESLCSDEIKISEEILSEVDAYNNESDIAVLLEKLIIDSCTVDNPCKDVIVGGDAPDGSPLNYLIVGNPVTASKLSGKSTGTEITVSLDTVVPASTLNNRLERLATAAAESAVTLACKKPLCPGATNCRFNAHADATKGEAPFMVVAVKPATKPGKTLTSKVTISGSCGCAS